MLEALGNYAELATDGRAFTRRLFADDSAQGFAFVDLCRERFDIALMNPPFGEARPTVVADLGQGVPDTAMVETAAYCLERVASTSSRG